MSLRFGTLLFVFALAFPAFATGDSQHPFRDVKIVQVDSTEIGNQAKVKSDFAPDLLCGSLKNALRSAGFEIGDSPVKIHLVLDEFSSGSTAERLVVGFGAGRSTVDARLMISTRDDEALVIHIKTRGHLLNSPYEGGDLQRSEAISSFEQRLLEQIYKLK